MNVNRIAPCAVALVLAACGSDGGSGGGSTGGSTAVDGTVAGVPFAGREAISAVVGPTTCTISGVSVSVAGLVIGVSNFAGTCSVAGNPCAGKQNAQAVVVALANLSPSALGQASPVGPGTFTVTPISAPTASTRQAFAALGRTDQACNDVASVPDVTGGTVTLSSVSGTSAAGNVSLTFSDGSTVSGPFTTSACSGLQVDVCSGTIAGFGSGASCTGSRVCQP